MAETATAPELRPIVPHLRLGATRDEDYLFASKCSGCGARYAGPRLFCANCSGTGPFEEIRLGRGGELDIWTIVYQATPYVKAPYVAGIVSVGDGVNVNANIDIEPKPENLSFGMKLEMYTEQVSQDAQGNGYIAYRYRPA